jgi:hypothetical protein
MLWIQTSIVIGLYVLVALAIVIAVRPKPGERSKHRE